MNNSTLSGFKLIGIKLPGQTTNANGQSAIDCGSLWQQFEKEKISEKIPGKLSEEIFAVYYDYEGDHTKPYSYFIGCKVKDDTEVPSGLNTISIPDHQYNKIIAKGKMPDCVADAWRTIWSSNMNRGLCLRF